MSVSLLAALIAFAPPTLVPGSTAPKLDVGGWLKYDAPKTQAGRFRVVEFWATWCEPCKANIPHLTEMAKAYKDRVDVVGVSVWEKPATTVQDLKTFVADFGPKMDYRVAYDGAGGAMAKTWLAAAGQNGIPASFLIDDKDRVLWIGHPATLEPVLKQALAGTLDVATTREAFLAKTASAERTRDAQAQSALISKRYLAGEYDAADADWNRLALASPEAASAAAMLRMRTYVQLYVAGRHEAAEKSWAAVAARSPELKDSVDATRMAAYSQRYKKGDAPGAEKAWAALAQGANPKIAVLSEIVRLQAYPVGVPERAALVAKMVAGTPLEQESVERVLTVGKPGDAAEAKAVADRLLGKNDDAAALYYAATLYFGLKAETERTRALDAALAADKDGRLRPLIDRLRAKPIEPASI